MAQFPGQYDLLFVPLDLAAYLALSAAEHMTAKREVATEIKNTIHLDQLQGWVFDDFKIIADADGHKAETEVQEELERLVDGLGQGNNRLSIKPTPDVEPVPVELGYDKQFDCEISCHHVYTLHIDRGSGTFAPWIIASSSIPDIEFELRVSMMWLSPSGVTPFVATAVPALAAAVTQTDAKAVRSRRIMEPGKTLAVAPTPANLRLQERAKRTGETPRKRRGPPARPVAGRRKA